jgi:hypothetical protein
MSLANYLHGVLCCCLVLLPALQVSDMVATLTLTGSSYLAPFLQLKEQIQQEAAAAQDNVRFLACLEGPCKALSKASPPEIPGLLPQILDCIRMIWSLSRFYNTPERISGLLRRLSNEVINRCCAALRLGDIFSGDVVGPMEALQQSMAAGGLRQRHVGVTGSTAATYAASSTAALAGIQTLLQEAFRQVQPSACVIACNTSCCGEMLKASCLQICLHSM